MKAGPVVDAMRAAKSKAIVSFPWRPVGEWSGCLKCATKAASDVFGGSRDCPQRGQSIRPITRIEVLRSVGY